jgi:hypothetical protein
MKQFIPLAQAVTMTTLYHLEKENILAAPFKNQNILARCETFDRTVFDTLLAKPECNAIRVYYGMDPTRKVHAIIVAVNSKNEDMLPSSAALTDDEDDDIGEEGRRCPDDCPPSSPLNP